MYESNSQAFAEKTDSKTVPAASYPRIVFMGTPEFAVASLDALVKAGFNIVAVITAPDKPAGRGMKVTESAVKKYAVAHNLKTLQPEKLKNPDFLEALKNLKADLQVVVAFRMLPEVVWGMPPLGTINVHGSLLPKYRGAAPINWAIINGEKETGVTTFKLTHQIDTGNILLQKRISIDEDDNAGDVHDKLMKEGAGLLVETIRKMIANDIQEKPQDMSATATHAPKIFTETCKISWDRSVTSIYNLVRGLSPYPGAFTELDGKTLKIFRSEIVADHSNIADTLNPGDYETDHKAFLRFRAADGYLAIKELQLEGKRRMPVEEFLRGFRKNA